MFSLTYRHIETDQDKPSYHQLTVELIPNLPNEQRVECYIPSVSPATVQPPFVTSF
jgi:hypothetical protein